MDEESSVHTYLVDRSWIYHDLSTSESLTTSDHLKLSHLLLNDSMTLSIQDQHYQLRCHKRSREGFVLSVWQNETTADQTPLATIIGTDLPSGFRQQWDYFCLASLRIQSVDPNSLTARLPTSAWSSMIIHPNHDPTTPAVARSDWVTLHHRVILSFISRSFEATEIG